MVSDDILESAITIDGVSESSGVRLVVGKIGWGKSFLSEIGKGKEVHTLEDPVEIDLSKFGIPQTLVEIDKAVINTDKCCSCTSKEGGDGE
ncbi:hypothetical protein [Shewanella algae]|jgi:type II secretory ATPase GspE/PulE/Tfp pilus assembly ATPase PilB-like protein|nr:hypothetical protein [Shewanella algae]MBO2575897.1 hypothetical protein [Shewanella algae]TVO83389.1 hypothetical protein AYI80_19430 [Shewanella algae]TXS83022.1 hypothetical protein AYI81_20440 [Shewanella algae]